MASYKRNPAADRVVLITGAAGGLGQGLVNVFAEAGWKVVAAYHRRSAHEESVRVHPVAMDVTDREKVKETVQVVEAKWGGIDVLVNNAGALADGPVARMSEEDWERVLGVNLRGAFHCAQAVLRGMARRRRGHIVNISSMAGLKGAAGQVHYAAAKAGLIGFTKSLAREVGSRNVRVNAVLPGVMPTPMTEGLAEEVRQAFAAANALGRLNAVEEVARFIVFLAGMENVSGQVFQLDSRVGGW